VGTAGTFLDDRYRLLRRSASGGGVDVYVAVDTLLGREVAIRRLRDDVHDREAHVERLRCDAAALAGVDSPHVAGVLDLRVGAAGAYLVLQRPVGPTFAELAGDGTAPGETIVRWIGQLLDGLTALHARGLVHRDLRGDDVVVCAGSRVVIHGAIVRRPGPCVDPRADVFRAGVLLVQLATGIDPTAIAEPLAVAFDALLARVPPRFDLVARRALGLDAPFPSAAAMRAALAPAD